MLLPLASVAPASDQPLPLLAAVCQVAPLSSDTCTDSPAASGADRLPPMVCCATLVMKSLLLAPVSADSMLPVMPVVGRSVPMVSSPLLLSLARLPARSVTLATTS